MSAFDTRLNVVGASVGTPDQEQLDAGTPAHVEVAITVGQALPFSQGDGQPLMVPLGTLRFSLSRQDAIDFFALGVKEAEALPVTGSGKIQVASAADLGRVGEAAARMDKFKG